MEEHAIRVHLNADNTVEKLKNFLAGSHDNYFFVLERDANRPHLQGYVRTTTKQQAFRAQFKKYFPENVGNSGYSVGIVRDTPKYLRYLCKGDAVTSEPEVIATHGIAYTEEWIQTEHREYWAANATYSTKGKRRESLVTQIYNNALSADYGDNMEEEICKDIICNVKNQKKAMNEFYIRSVLNTVMCLLNSQWEMAFIRRIVQRGPIEQTFI